MLLPWRDVPLGSTLIRTSLTPAEGQKLHDLAQGGRVLEVGSAFGYSAIRMAAMAKSVLAIDPHEDLQSLGVMRANLLTHDVHRRVAIMLARSAQALALLERAGARFDLIFIDGDHSFPAVCADVQQARELLAPSGVLACHDYGEDTCPGVKAALDVVGPPGASVVDTLWLWRNGDS